MNCFDRVGAVRDSTGSELMSSFATRMSGDPGPVYVVYDCRGQRARKRFESGAGREARSFYLAKARAGKNPRVVRADDGPVDAR